MINLLLLFYSISLLIFIARTQIRARGSSEGGLDELTNTLHAVRTSGIIDLIHLPELNKPVDKPILKVLYTKIGGNEGLERMQHNLGVLIKIAHTLNSQNQEFSSLAVSQLQKNYFRLKVNTFVLRRLLQFHYYGPNTLALLKGVAGAYHQAVEQLLDLHDKYAPLRKARMIAACNWQAALAGQSVASARVIPLA